MLEGTQLDINNGPMDPALQAARAKADDCNALQQYREAWHSMTSPTTAKDRRDLVSTISLLKNQDMTR